MNSGKRIFTVLEQFILSVILFKVVNECTDFCPECNLTAELHHLNIWKLHDDMADLHLKPCVTNAPLQIHYFMMYDEDRW